MFRCWDLVSQAMESFGYATMTRVQQQSFGPVLAGGELLARAKTGSGKTRLESSVKRNRDERERSLKLS